MPKLNQKIHQGLLSTLIMVSLAFPLWAAPVGDWQGQIQIPGKALTDLLQENRLNRVG